MARGCARFALAQTAWHGMARGLQPSAVFSRSRPFFTPPTQDNLTMHFSFTRLAFLGFGIAAALPSAFAADGKAVYDKTCVACHASGVANAPKFGDKAAWAPRAATGKDALLASVIKGKGAMPPKAGAADLKDDDIKAAIEFMLAAVK
jgi:cytochrome c5